MYIVGPIVICFSNSKVLLLHVILMQISRQCRVDLVLEIGKDELWLFFGYYCGSSRKLWPKCIAKFSFCSAAVSSDAKNNYEKRRRHPPYPISWSYSKIREIGKGRLWEAGGFVSIKMQKALFHFQFHYFLD